MFIYLVPGAYGHAPEEVKENSGKFCPRSPLPLPQGLSEGGIHCLRTQTASLGPLTESKSLLGFEIFTTWYRSEQPYGQNATVPNYSNSRSLLNALTPENQPTCISTRSTHILYKLHTKSSSPQTALAPLIFSRVISGAAAGRSSSSLLGTSGFVGANALLLRSLSP